MAIEVFSWKVEARGDGEITFAQRATQFGDGYRQIAGDGINGESQSWSITHTGNKATATDIAAFLRRHKAGKAFLWIPPLGELGLYTCAGFKPTNMGGDVWRIAATFDQTFHP